MSEFDIFAIGNALVDLEYQVSDDFLRQHQIEKGVMTLVNPERQNYLLGNMQGELMKSQSGGSAANTVIAAASLGAKTFYNAKVGNDEFGEIYQTDLNHCGVSHNFAKAANGTDQVTGTCLVMVTDDAQRTMNTHLGISASFSQDDLVIDALKRSDLLYIEGYLVCNPNSFQAALKAKDIAKKAGVATALTFSDPFVIGSFKDQFKELLRDGVDYLFANEEEVASYCGEALSAHSLKKLSEQAKVIVATQGPKGIMGYHNNNIVEIAPSQVIKPIDTNGAGDMVAGCFLYGVSHGLSFEQSCKLANTGAAAVIQQFGPRLAPEKLKEILTGVQ